MILSAEDKNNSNINRRLMGAFRSTIEELELKEISLTGRKFIWSNNVTHTRIDRFFFHNRMGANVAQLQIVC